jgi:hypothetical protein
MADARYWLTPSALYSALDREFGFDFDPCPYPRPANWCATKVPWGKSNFVNPPFHRENGVGPTAIVKRAIAEHRAGRASVLLLPVQSYIPALLEAGAELRSVGRVKWVEVESGAPSPNPSPIVAAILRGALSPTPPEAR